jgi:ketosteroid isomerase-like protein
MRVTPCVAIALLVAACAPKPETPEQTAARLKAESDTARLAIEAQNARIMRYLAAAQPDSVASVYAEDAVAYPMDEPPVRGRPALDSAFRTWMGTFSLAYKVTTTSVEASGSIAVETGHTDARLTPKPNAPRGTKAGTYAFSYVAIWRKTGGQWLISRDIPTTGEPEQPAPAKQN